MHLLRPFILFENHPLENRSSDAILTGLNGFRPIGFSGSPIILRIMRAAVLQGVKCTAHVAAFDGLICITSAQGAHAAGFYGLA